MGERHLSLIDQERDRPIAIVSGENDAILPIEKNALMLGESIPSATVHIFEGEAGHPIFLNRPTDLGKKELSEEITLDPPSVDRHHIHQKANSLKSYQTNDKQLKILKYIF